jgi:hypothetical protein
MASRKVSTREMFLAAILIGVLVWTIWYLTGKAMEGAGAGASESSTVAFRKGDAPQVRIDLLAGAAEPYDQNGRDLFKYSKRPPTAEELEAERRRLEAERLAREEALRRQREARANRENTGPKQTPPRPPGPRPPKITFQYIGYLGPKDDRIAVFENGEELLLARVGEKLQEKFELREIDYESVVIGYTDPRFEKQTKTLNQTR